MANDRFVEADLIHGILSGKIVQRQKDRITREWKYTIHGNSTQPHRKIGLVVKEKNKVIIITVFEEI